MSNLYKGAFISREEKGSVIIDANDLFEKRLEEKKQLEELRALARPRQTGPVSEEEFEQLDPDQLEQLTADQDLMREAAEEDGSFQEGLPMAEAGEELVSAQAAQEALAAVQEQADQIIAQAEQQAEEIRANAARLGHDDGYNKGYEEATHAQVIMEATFQQKEKELQENCRRMIEDAEPEMVDVLTRIYEHVFGVRLAGDKSVILHLLQQTLSHAEPTGDFLIHASSADYDTLLDSREELRESIPNPNCNLEIVEDTFLKENECMIETDGGVFDCGVGTQLSELTKKLKLLSWQNRDQ
ncbi:MAG: hypothetical protein K6G16_04480 [Lachnospiraceae bacterium]|nr:hypothetical protein [Lachnospiraceae bacterium]